MPTGGRLGPPPLPREHGAWAMLLTPVVTAVLVLGPSLSGLMAALGWVMAYALRGPAEVLLGTGPTGKAGMASAEPAVARRYLVLFGALAALGLVPAAVREPHILLLLAGAGVLLALVHWLAAKGEGRSVRAGLLAILGLMAGAPLYELAATGTVSQDGWVIALACGAFFAGSVFRVKALARERRSVGFRTLSVVLHVLALGVAVGAVPFAGGSVLVPAAFVLPLGWAVWGAVRAGRPVSLLVIGKGEQWLTILFALLLVAGLRWG